MQIILSVQFITGIIFVVIGFYLLYLLKQNKAKIIVRGEVRLEIKSFQAYSIILLGLTSVGIAAIRNLIPDLPSWGTIPITLTILLLIFLTMRNRN